MKKKWTNIILITVFIVGLSLLLYPTVSDYWNSRTQTRVIVDYENTVGAMEEKDFTKLFEAADDYNRQLRELAAPLLEYEKLTGYEGLLSINADEAIGYITIKKIRVQLPIYHGTSDEVLNVAVGHLEGTSLPVGGESTHSVLSSHRGLPSAKLFTYLDKLEEGDTFTIKVLDRTLTYQVDQILIVEPGDTEALAIVPGEDYCTLLTCTPYGINTHRLLVRGTRIENLSDENIAADAFTIDPLIMATLVAVPILLILLVILLVKHRKKKSDNKRE